MMEFLEIPLFDDDILKLGVRLLLNLCFLTIIVRYAMGRSQVDREFVFSAVMMNITVFFICFTLKKLELGLGMAIGLFAIFGVLRYRTDAIRIKEMTYLFIIIGIAVINALSNKKTSYAELLAVNVIIFYAARLTEKFVVDGQEMEEIASSKKLLKHTLNYDNLDLLAPERQADLLVDLRQRTGINVSRVQIKNIDLQNSIAILTVWYEASNSDSEETD